MFDSTRRAFLQQTAMGLATVGATGLILRCDAQPTQEINRNHVLIQMGPTPAAVTPTAELKKITPQPYGPFYRTGAPFRGKLSLPGEPGTTFILSGRVWAFDTKRPLPGAVLDFWHVDMQEKYSNGVSDFRNRGRLVSSETGYYELESIRPIPYRPDPTGRFLAVRALSSRRGLSRLPATRYRDPFSRRSQAKRSDVSSGERDRGRGQEDQRNELSNRRVRHRAGTRSHEVSSN